MNESNNRTIYDLVNGKGDVYVLLPDQESGAKFMAQAGIEGFRFGDGLAAGARDPGDVMCIGEDRSISYVGFTGHMAYHAGKKNGKPVNRVDFKKYASGEEDYFCRF